MQDLTTKNKAQLLVHGKSVRVDLKKVKKVSPIKTQRIECRANESQKNLIEKAATLLNMTVSQYVLSIATSAAKETLDNHAKYMVDEENWNRVISAIDSPRKPNGVLTPAIQMLREMGEL